MRCGTLAIEEHMSKHKCRSLCLAATSLLIASGSAWGATPGETHTVGGTISGLTGKGLVLRLNGQGIGFFNVMPPPGATSFVFPTGLPTGAAYAVTVQAQPVGPIQQCAVTRGQGGRIGNADVSGAVVDCNVASDSLRPGTQHPGSDLLVERTWDLYLDAFQADVDIENLSFSDGYCSMSGGPVNAKFRESPSTHGKPVGSIVWKPNGPKSISIEFTVDSEATVGAQSGQSSPGAPLRCASMSHHFKNNTYRIVGEMSALTSPAVLTSPMPQNDDTAGNVGCEPEGNTCHLQFYFDNSPGTTRTTLDLPTLLATGSVVVPIRGTATNVAGYGEKRSGSYKWSGTMKLRVPK
jgi:hypothetical protein